MLLVGLHHSFHSAHLSQIQTDHMWRDSWSMVSWVFLHVLAIKINCPTDKLPGQSCEGKFPVEVPLHRYLQWTTKSIYHKPRIWQLASQYISSVAGYDKLVSRQISLYIQSQGEVKMCWTGPSVYQVRKHFLVLQRQLTLFDF